MINFCMAAKEYQKTSELSSAMLLVCIFQFIYVADCLFYEVSRNVIHSIGERLYKACIKRWGKRFAAVDCQGCHRL